MKKLILFVVAVGLTVSLMNVCLGEEAHKATLLKELNLLTNSSFEEGNNIQAQGWLLDSGGAAELPDNIRARFIWSDEQAHSGRKSLEVIGGLWGDARIRTQYSVILKPGERYMLTGWYRAQSWYGWEEGKAGPSISVLVNGKPVDYDYSKGTVVTHLEGEEELNARLNFQVEPDFEASARTGWKKFELFFTVPEGKNPYWARVHLNTLAVAHQTWFDDIYLVPVPAFRIVEPEMPIICERNSTVSVKVAVTDENGEAVSEVKNWQAFANETPLKVTKTPFLTDEGLWQIELTVPEVRGFSYLKIHADVADEMKEFVKSNYLYTIPKTKDTFSFVAIADPCVYEDRLKKGSLINKTRSTINTLDPTMVLSIGDIFGWNSFWGDAGFFFGVDNYRKYISGFDMPVYSVAGNHDMDPGFTGERTRYYYRRYLGIPYFYSFNIGSYHFVAMDSTIAASAEWGAHGGDFDVPGQLEWLANDLQNATNQGLKPVIFLHHPVYMEFKLSPEREKAIDLFFKYNTAMVLAGHWHGSLIRAKKNPYFTGDTDLPEVILKGSYAGAHLPSAYRNNPAFTLFETVTNFSGFLRDPEVNYKGYRYIWVKDGKVAYDDILSNAIEMEMPESTDTKKTMEIRNPYTKANNIKHQISADRDFENVPIKFEMKSGYEYKAYVKETGSSLPLFHVDKGDAAECWVQVDIKKDTNESIVVEQK